MASIQSEVPGTGPAGKDRGLESMRDVLLGNLGRSLRGIDQFDRLSAAWTVACGRLMAERGTPKTYDGNTLQIEVQDGAWLSQMVAMRSVLARQITKASGLRVDSLEFQLKRGVTR